jgi:hypothetical protein
LPSWASFCLELGTIIGNLPDDGNRRVVALAVPARHYVSVLIAAGLILARATGSSRYDQAAEHLRRLKKLPVGSPVFLRHGQRRLRGIYRGYHQGFGKLYFSIQTEQRNRTQINIPTQDAYKIEVIDEKVQLPQRQKGHVIDEVAPLLKDLLGGSALRFSRENQIDCALIGTRSVFEDELETQRLATSTGMDRVGTLLDILRPRPLLSSGVPNRSYLIPSSSRRVSDLARSLRPHAVLFDGGLSFLKWEHVWREPHSVIVLDRTGSNFNAAVEQVNQHFIQYRIDGDEELDIPSVPVGIELMTFQVNG